MINIHLIEEPDVVTVVIVSKVHNSLARVVQHPGDPSVPPRHPSRFRASQVSKPPRHRS